MYLHLGGGVTIPADDLIAIFDLDNVSASGRTRQFLARAQEEGMIFPIGCLLSPGQLAADLPLPHGPSHAPGPDSGRHIVLRQLTAAAVCVGPHKFFI